MEVCANCGQLVKTLDDYTGWCSECSGHELNKLELFLANNADHIEHYIILGNSVSVAITLVYAELRRHRTCPSCGEVIKRGSAKSVFCRKYKQCRSRARRYVYLYENKGMTKAQALATVLDEIENGRKAA